jgi:hypothetical protein
VLDAETVSHADLAKADERVRRCEHEWHQAGAFRVDESQVEDALQFAQSRQVELDSAKAQSRRGLKLRYLNLVRLFSQSGLTRFGPGQIIGYSAAAICALSLAVSPFVFPTLASAMLGVLVVSVLGSLLLAATVFLLWPNNTKLLSYQRLHRQWAEAVGRVAALSPLAAEARKDYEGMRRAWELCDRLRKARRNRDEIAAVLSSARYQLLHADWRLMRGVEFEQFLQRVFESLGYQVQSTKASGDQGADLVVTGKGKKIAVQAKGYSDSVGNHAVMEVVAGMGFYRCGCCAVVTNSRFTRNAIDLARANDCRLVDGQRIRDLIEGRIY